MNREKGLWAVVGNGERVGKERDCLGANTTAHWNDIVAAVGVILLHANKSLSHWAKDEVPLGLG